jgi:uncharacterized membrane protein YcaP (DUF421 family)
MEYGVSFLSIKNQRLSRLIQGSPVVMIKDGKIIRENLGKENFNVDDLMQELRKQGIRDVNEVETGILEPSGGFSVILKGAEEPVTRGELGLDWQPTPNSILTNRMANREEIFALSQRSEVPQPPPLSLARSLEEIQLKLDQVLQRLETLEKR